jgi:branched-chain amino acid transport system permease protein
MTLPGARIANQGGARLIAARPWLAVAIAAALIGPFVLSGYHVFQLTQIVIYAVAVLGLNLLTGFSGQISLGNGAFYAIGAYTAVLAMARLGVPYWLTPPLAGAVCFAAGYVFGRSSTRLEGLYLALATFALGAVFPTFIRLDKLERWTGGSMGVTLTKPTTPLGVLDDDQWLYFVCLAFAAAMFAIAWNLVRGRTGRAFVALRDHPIAAAAMGIDVARYKSLAFGISAMYTGVAGALGALAAGFISPDSFTVLVSIQFLVGGVIGGIVSLFGAVFGAAFIELVPDLAKKLSDGAAAMDMPRLAEKLADAPAVLYGVLLIVIMIVMPGGFAGLVHALRRRLGRDRPRT